MTQSKKPSPTKPAGGSGTARVRAHTRRTASGRQTTVRAHTRIAPELRQAGAAWAGAGAAGLTSLGMVLMLGFQLITVVCLLLTVLLATLAARLTGKARPRRKKAKRKTAREQPAPHRKPAARQPAAARTPVRAAAQPRTVDATRFQPRKLEGTLHAKGTPEYAAHVKREQQATITHIEQALGRALGAADREALSKGVADELDRRHR